MTKGGGFHSLKYAIRVAAEVGPKKFLDSIRSKNTCKTCAYGMGGQQGGMRNEAGHFPEICKKSMQAQLTDLQPEIPKDKFQNISIEEFKSFRGRELERLGRLNYPLYKGNEDDHYSIIEWSDALQKTTTAFKEASPDRTFFYSSGRSSNEAAFLLQLFARLYGTNNINNCSYYCHQASGVGLNSVIGSGTATIDLYDLKGADCIFVIGANPASNHPRFITELLACRRRGGNVVVVNPAKEPGMVKFAVPSDIRSLLSGGSDIASHYIQPHAGGDIAFLKGVAKYVLDQGKADDNFIASYTNGFKKFANDVQATDWKMCEYGSGVSKQEIEKIGEVYCSAKNVVFAWAMGITHHTHGVQNVESIANLALLRGMIGRKYAGLAPIRGHSNVQGVGSVGFTPALKEKVFENLQDHLGIKLPTAPGMDTMACMHAAHNGEIDTALMLGGNLYGSNPDQRFTATALNKINCKIYMNTTMNMGHFHGSDKEMIILPVAARDEEKQSTTQESMFNFVRLSDGGIVRLDNVRSEVDVISDIASNVLNNNKIDFQVFKNHNTIRESIAETIPGFDGIRDIAESKKEFTIQGRIFHKPEFATPDRKASFQVVPFPAQIAVGKNEFRMITVRSEGQFNTIIYEEEDIYRGQKDRWVVLMNDKDILECGFAVGDRVTLESETGVMKNVRVAVFDVRAGNVITYYPESNVLVSNKVDTRSNTPGFKNTVVNISKSL